MRTFVNESFMHDATMKYSDMRARKTIALVQDIVSRQRWSHTDFIRFRLKRNNLLKLDKCSRGRFIEMYQVDGEISSLSLSTRTAL